MEFAATATTNAVCAYQMSVLRCSETPTYCGSESCRSCQSHFHPIALVAAGVGMDLRAIERYRAHLQHAHLARQEQNLHEQRLDLLRKTPPEKRTFIVSGKRSLMAMVS